MALPTSSIGRLKHIDSVIARDPGPDELLAMDAPPACHVWLKVVEDPDNEGSFMTATWPRVYGTDFPADKSKYNTKNRLQLTLLSVLNSSIGRQGNFIEGQDNLTHSNKQWMATTPKKARYSLTLVPDKAMYGTNGLYKSAYCEETMKCLDEYERSFARSEAILSLEKGANRRGQSFAAADKERANALWKELCALPKSVDARTDFLLGKMRDKDAAAYGLGYMKDGHFVFAPKTSVFWPTSNPDAARESADEYRIPPQDGLSYTPLTIFDRSGKKIDWRQSDAREQAPGEGLIGGSAVAVTIDLGFKSDPKQQQYRWNNPTRLPYFLRSVQVAHPKYFEKGDAIAAYSVDDYVSDSETQRLDDYDSDVEGACARAEAGDIERKRGADEEGEPDPKRARTD